MAYERNADGSGVSNPVNPAPISASAMGTNADAIAERRRQIAEEKARRQAVVQRNQTSGASAAQKQSYQNVLNTREETLEQQRQEKERQEELRLLEEERRMREEQERLAQEARQEAVDTAQAAAEAKRDQPSSSYMPYGDPRQKETEDINPVNPRLSGGRYAGDYPEYTGEQPEQRNKNADYYRGRELMQPVYTTAQQSKDALKVGNILTADETDDETEFYTGQPTSEEPNDAMEYWRNRKYPAYTGGDFRPSNVNPDWTPANPVPNTPKSATDLVTSIPGVPGVTDFGTKFPGLTGIDTTKVTAPDGTVIDVNPLALGAQNAIDEFNTSLKDRLDADPELKALYDENVNAWKEQGYSQADAEANATRNMSNQLGIPVPEELAPSNKSSNLSTNPFVRGISRFIDDSLENVLLGPAMTSILKAIPNGEENFAAGLGNIGKSIEKYQQDVAEYGKISDKVLNEAIAEVAVDPEHPTDQELARASKLAGDRLKEMDVYPEFVVENHNENAFQTNNPVNSNYGDAMAAARQAAANAGLVPGTLAYENYVNRAVKAYNNPLQQAEDRFASVMVGSHFTPQQEQQFYDRMSKGMPPTIYELENLKAPGYDALGRPNETLQLILDNNTGYYVEDPTAKDEKGNPYEMPVEKHDDGNYYRPYWDPKTGNTTYEQVDADKVKEKTRYTPEQLLRLYADPWSNEPGTTWRGGVADVLNDPSLTPEERAGLQALLASIEYGGQDVPGGRELFPREIFNGTDEQYDRLVELFINKVPGLKELLDSDAVTEQQIVQFFLKSPSGTSNSGKGSGSGSGSGGGYRGRYYGGYGGYGYTPRSYNGGYNYNYRNNNRGVQSNPSTANQRQNRVYNIMKNWSF